MIWVCQELYSLHCYTEKTPDYQIEIELQQCFLHEMRFPVLEQKVLQDFELLLVSYPGPLKIIIFGGDFWVKGK